MEALLNAALVGTGRQASPAPVSAVPTEELLARLPASGAERQLLLRAGAWAVYRLAGQTAPAMPPASEPAPPETLRPCSSRAAQLIVELLGGDHADLLPEALARLRQAGQIMPPESLLPLLACDPARNSTIQPMRAGLVAALGARGRWLAQRNDDWRWVLETASGEIGLPLDADVIWQEGTPAQRRALFRLVRHADPARAREWLAAVWKQEKADMRADLIPMLDDNLSATDEPFLTQALDDKTERVRAAVAKLLARIPTSSLAARLRERADGLLDYTAGTLQVKPPKAFDPTWQRDGIKNDPPRGSGKRAWWLLRLLDTVPPAHWQARFGASPTELIAAAGRTEYEAALVEGWSWAALAHAGDSTGWIVPLWEWWLITSRAATPGGVAARDLRDQLGAHVPPAIAETRALQIMNDPTAPAYESWEGLVNALPAPWSDIFGAQFLSMLRAAVATLTQTRQDSDRWLPVIARAGAALPPACWDAALAEWEFPEAPQTAKQRYTAEYFTWQQWKSHVERLCEALRIRQTLNAEIRVPVEEHHA